jgi:hypothetical protein
LPNSSEVEIVTGEFFDSKEKIERPDGRYYFPEIQKDSVGLL